MSWRTVSEIFDEAMFKRGAQKVNSFSKVIGYEWEHFGAIEGDRAKRVETGDPLVYLILYECPPGEFPKHIHPEAESGIVLMGSCEITTSQGKWIAKESDVYFIEAQKAHKFKFLSKRNMLVITFSPAPKEWSAQF